MPNVTNLVASGMPKGCGRKGGATPHTITNSYNRSIDVCRKCGRLGGHIAGGSSLISSDLNFTPITMVQPGHSPFGADLPYPYPCPYPYSYLYQPQPTSVLPASNPFTVRFIKGNISSSIGCHNWYWGVINTPPFDTQLI